MVFRLWIPETHILLLFALDFFSPVSISVEIIQEQLKSLGLWPRLAGIKNLCGTSLNTPILFDVDP
jgi:hypothetical protein